MNNYWPKFKILSPVLVEALFISDEGDVIRYYTHTWVSWSVLKYVFYLSLQNCCQIANKTWLFEVLIPVDENCNCSWNNSRIVAFCLHTDYFLCYAPPNTSLIIFLLSQWWNSILYATYSPTWPLNTFLLPRIERNFEG